MTDLFRGPLGNTPLFDDEKSALIPSLATQRELNEFEYENILSAQDWALSPRRLAKAEILTASYLFELHRRMFNATWRWAGKTRTTEKTIGVAPHRILQDLGALLSDAQHWVENETHPRDEIAIRIHHRLVWIHPFANGNGRHARLAADALVLKSGGDRFAWGRGTAEASAIRAAYLAALRLADQQDYQPLFRFARSGSI